MFKNIFKKVKIKVDNCLCPIKMVDNEAIYRCTYLGLFWSVLVTCTYHRVMYRQSLVYQLIAMRLS